jgi:hypothetical protein
LAAFCASPVETAMDGIVARLCAAMDEEALYKLDEKTVEGFITPEERRVLAMQYWCFDVNVPVTVSVMRDVDQAVVPFWLAESGFEKTSLIVKNEEYTYEVWQKRFDAGRVELGINGFDMHRPHYFVCVGPQRTGDTLGLSGFFPERQTVLDMREGSLTYHDWTELVLTEVPESLRGQKLLTTIRGRAREAHLIEAFRKTPYPTSTKPDQIVLTWSEDPRTTQTIQWRTSPKAEKCVVRYKKKGAAGEAIETEGAYTTISDRLLLNDPVMHRFTAVLRGLEPGTVYTYTVGNPETGEWSVEAEFATAPDDGAPFSFVFMGDTHRSEDWGKMLGKAFERHPETAFYMIAGDLVSTGLYRDDWDHFFGYSADVFRNRPVVPTLGNHDDQDGLGARMYLDFFALPENGSEAVERERSYTFRYGNALFIVLDVTSSVEAQKAWLEQQLAATDAPWKFAMFHFPPYAFDEDYPDIRQAWCTLFDKYHVDMVFNGHVHYYLRTKPMRDGKPVASPAEGTVYAVSIAIPGARRPVPKPRYAETTFCDGALYQTIAIDGKRLTYRAYNAEGNIRDEFVIEK